MSIGNGVPAKSICPLIFMNVAIPAGDTTISVWKDIPSADLLSIIIPIELLMLVGPSSTVVMKSIIDCSRANSVKHASTLVALSL